MDGCKINFSNSYQPRTLSMVKESSEWSYACMLATITLTVHSPTGEVLDSFSPSSALENTDNSDTQDITPARHTRAYADL